jgi:hypothetical protein
LPRFLAAERHRDAEFLKQEMRLHFWNVVEITHYDCFCRRHSGDATQQIDECLDRRWPRFMRLSSLRRQRGIDDARVSKREVLIRRGDQWFRYGAPKRSECVELDARSLSKCDRELTVKSCTQV